MNENRTCQTKRGRYHIVPFEEIDDLRDVWPDEARDFTPWLASEEGLSILSEVLGVNKISCPKQEKSHEMSDRRCDIVAQVDSDEEGNPATIIIENQLEKTDFSHLGRLILYAAGNENTRYVVWIVREVTEDHRRTIAWLNRNTTAEIVFYLLKVSAYRLPGDDRCAPLLTPVEVPDRREKVEKSGTPRQKRNWDFWSGFREFAESGGNRERIASIATLRPGSWDNWYDISIGTSACHFALWHSNGRADISIVANTKEAFKRISAILPELHSLVGVGEERIVVNGDNAHPVIRYHGMPCRRENERIDAYSWLVDKLSALVPVVQKALGV